MCENKTVPEFNSKSITQHRLRRTPPYYQLFAWSFLLSRCPHTWEDLENPKTLIPIRSTHFKFRIQNLRTRDKNGTFSLCIHAFTCDRQPANTAASPRTFRKKNWIRYWWRRICPDLAVHWCQLLRNIARCSIIKSVWSALLKNPSSGG